MRNELRADPPAPHGLTTDERDATVAELFGGTAPCRYLSMLHGPDARPPVDRIRERIDAVETHG